MLDPQSFMDGLMDRVNGPMSFRLLLQPLMACFFAFRDGRKDAREERTPFFWGLFTDPEHLGYLLKSGWRGVGKVFIIAMVLDVVFQWVFFKNFRAARAPLYAGVILAVIPYVLLRGSVTRLLRRPSKGGSHEPRA